MKFRLLNGYRFEFSDDDGKTWKLVCEINWTRESHGQVFLDFLLFLETCSKYFNGERN